MNVFEDTYLADILHDIAQALLIPTIVFVIALIVVSIFFIGQLVVEFFAERRHFRQNMSEIVNDVNDVAYHGVTRVVADSAMLRFQKAALITVSRNMGLPEDALFSLAQAQIGKVERHYQRRLAWTDTISKIAPLLGLMGTLIPLGPGIVAMGQGDVTTLSQSLLVAFDATVCGLVCAIVALVISKVRSGWYGEYVSSLEQVMTCVLEKAQAARAEGVELPANYTGDPLAEFKAGDRAGAPAAGEKRGD